MNKENTGTIKQILGAVVDVEFEGSLPKIFTALTATVGGKKLVLETEQHIGSNVVRAVAMGSTDGLRRGDKVESSGAGITVPVGKETLGRMFDVLGDPIDGQAAPKTEKGSENPRGP